MLAPNAYQTRSLRVISKETLSWTRLPAYMLSAVIRTNVATQQCPW